MSPLRQQSFLPASVFLVALLSLHCPVIGRAFEPSSEKQIITLPLSRTDCAVDGAIKDGEYGDAVVLGGSFKGWAASPHSQSPTVYLKRTAERLYVAVDNPLNEGERPSIRGAVPDNPGIAMGNAVEMFILPHQADGELLEYIHFIGNARGCVSDSISRPQVGVSYVAEFNVPWNFRNAIVPGHWYSELSSTFADLHIKKTDDGEWFDFDIGRDGGTGPNKVHSYTMAFHTIQSGNGVRVVFDEQAPVTQWLSFGDFENARLNARLRLLGSGRPENLTVTVAVHGAKKDADGSLPLQWSEEKTVALTETGEAEVDFFHELKSGEKGVARYRITTGDGRTLFFRELPFETGVRSISLYEQAEPQPLVVTAALAPSYGRIGVSADIIDYDGNKEKVAVNAIASHGGRELARIRMDAFALDYASGVLDVGELREGEYEVAFVMVDRDSGHDLGPRASITLNRNIYEWENNRLGLGDRVPEPWTQVETTEDSVSVWGRDYTFTGLGFPTSIPTLQPNPALGPERADVLSGPVRLVSEVAGAKETWRAGGLKTRSAGQATAQIEGSATSDTLQATLHGSLDFDGFYKIHLRIEPKGAPVEYESIRVEVPVATHAARLFHGVGESMRVNKTFADLQGRADGVLWDSKTAARNSIIKGNFLPIAWLGNEDRGIAWMCDNDRTWQIDFDKPALDVVRVGDETAFRMHLLNRPGTLEEPIDVVFSLQATPIRPRPPGGTWKNIEWYGWGHFDMPLLYDGCFDAYRKGEEPKTGGRPWYRTNEARAENRWWRYGCFNSDRIPESDPTYGSIRRDFGAEWFCDSIWVKYQNRSHQDFELWAWKQWHDEASMDGVYFDNTFPAPSTNLLNNTAYLDRSGTLRPGYVVMAYREFMKRLRLMLLEFGPTPVLKAHITDTPIPGYLGLCDFWLDGENGGYPDPKVKSPDFVDRWYNATGMANLRITCGQQWGTIPMYLYDWGIEPTHAVLGMFDLPNWFMPMGARVYHDFGIADADVRFVPYWTAEPPVTVVDGGPDVFVTAWKKPGQARLMISNLSDEDRDVIVKIDPTRLGVDAGVVAVDERQGGVLPKQGDHIGPIRVPRHDYQTLIVAESGRYQPYPTDFGASLEPPKNLRVTSLCDDFSDLSSAWEPHLSPDIGRVAGGGHAVPSEPLCVRWGALRIRSGPYLYANIRRPFGIDNCSVQVQFRRPGNYITSQWKPVQFGEGMGPALALRWNDGREIRVTCSGQGGDEVFTCVGTNADGSRGFRKGGPKLGFINSLRVELHADSLSFWGSADGEDWQQIHRVSRAGFMGPPDTLLLGQGADIDVNRTAYAVDVYYDNLVVAQLEE
jgi:hypothetical protein